MLSAVFLVFLVGAIVACQDWWMILSVVVAPAVVDEFCESSSFERMIAVVDLASEQLAPL
jgi:hypothetical protein